MKNFTNEELVKSMKLLISSQTWKDYVQHIQENIIPAHKEACINNAFTGNEKEARNQACLIEGIIEVIEEPQNVIDTLEQSPIKKFCNACKRLLQ